MPAKNVTGRRIGAAFIDLALYTAHPDPSGALLMRWWDGQHWTAHTR